MYQWSSDKSWKKLCRGPLPQKSSNLQSRPIVLTTWRECSEGSVHPLSFSAIFCIASSLDKEVAAAPITATLLYSHTGSQMI